MDNRPQLLTIPSYPSMLKYSSPHTSPLSPLIPPARLHLRTLLPSPPISPRLAKPPPPIPYPWIWRCHICHSVYQLGVTRRCLEDGHYFCSLPTPSTTPLSPSPVTPTSPSSSTHPSRTPPKKKRRRKPPRGCRAEFDYSGWETYNLWRRETSLLTSQPPRTPRLKTTKDCYRDCDFPSECQTIPCPSSSASKRKSDPDLMFPLSPSEILRLEAEAASEKENEQLLFDIAATTPPCIGSLGTVPLTGRERRRSLEAEKRGVEDEALFALSPPITALVDPDVARTLEGWDFNTGLIENRNQQQQANHKLGTSRSEGNLLQMKGSGKGKQREIDINLPLNFGKPPHEEETEEDEELIVREFIRVKKKKSIAKIEQLTGLKLSEVQYGKMVGEEVMEGFDGGERSAGGGGGRSGIGRGGAELDSPPSSPLKMFYTVGDSDTESGSEGEGEEGDEGGYEVGYEEEEENDKLTWDEVRYGVR
ncbi:hypothetical protein CJF30_00010292 [Rutstroemia sp. NJR-2017a BBW]|nr:hypothetical protein CJF30_00010292 [Rutstroemia sp. NJR-2017a BBW]